MIEINTEVDPHCSLFENLFCSKGRTKIIQLLALKTELNISEIIRKTGLNHSVVDSHLEEIGEQGLVEEKKFGRIRIFRYKEENMKARAIKKLVLFLNDAKEG